MNTDLSVVYVLCLALVIILFFFFFVFFFNDTATTEIYTLSLHDALPISHSLPEKSCWGRDLSSACFTSSNTQMTNPDRKSTRLNSSHITISYAVFCLKKKK